MFLNIYINEFSVAVKAGFSTNEIQSYPFTLKDTHL